MTVSLQAFLETYPYKTKACLEHICSALGISTNGTVVTLRTRIVEYGENKAKDNENLEEKIKDMAHKFKEHKKNGSLSKTPKGVNPKYPLSPVALLSSAPRDIPWAITGPLSHLLHHFGHFRIIKKKRVTIRPTDRRTHPLIEMRGRI